MKSHYSVIDQKNGYQILIRIGCIIDSCETSSQLKGAKIWFNTLCDRHLWLQHHETKFDYLTVVKKTKLENNGGVR